jgi:hypothetical protein
MKPQLASVNATGFVAAYCLNSIDPAVIGLAADPFGSGIR